MLPDGTIKKTKGLVKGIPTDEDTFRFKTCQENVERYLCPLYNLIVASPAILPSPALMTKPSRASGGEITSGGEIVSFDVLYYHGDSARVAGIPLIFVFGVQVAAPTALCFAVSLLFPPAVEACRTQSSCACATAIYA